MLFVCEKELNFVLVKLKYGAWLVVHLKVSDRDLLFICAFFAEFFDYTRPHHVHALVSPLKQKKIKNVFAGRRKS
jgi:hypothetical protein